MRIIKAATRIDEHITTCANCGSYLGLKRSDLSNDSRRDDSLNEDWRYYCAVCNSVNHITGKLNKLFPWMMEDNVNDGQIQSNNTLRVNTL